MNQYAYDERIIASAALKWLLQMDKAGDKNESATYFFRNEAEREAARRFIQKTIDGETLKGSSPQNLPADDACQKTGERCQQGERCSQVDELLSKLLTISIDK